MKLFENSARKYIGMYKLHFCVFWTNSFIKKKQRNIFPYCQVESYTYLKVTSDGK